MINNIRVKKVWLIFYIISLISALLIPYLSVELQIIIFTLITFVCLFLSKENGILHPLSWFPIFYLLYGISFVVYESLEESNLLFIDQIIPLAFLGLAGFMTPLIFFNKNKILFPMVRLKNNSIKLVWSIFGIVCILLIVYVIGSGVSSKREFLDNIGGMGSLFVSFSIIPLIYCIKLIKEKKFSVLDPYFILTFLLLFIAFGVTGERDYIFRFLFFILLMYFSIKKYNLSIFILLMMLVVIVMPLTQLMKGYLISTESIVYSFEFKLNTFFYNDFYSAGRNLNYILEKQIPLMYGETFIWDIKRFFNFIYVDQQSTGAWFNDSFRAQYRDIGTSGWGFSLVAEAYMNFGKLGVFCLYSLIGLISGILYKISYKNLYNFLFYLLYVVVVIYVTRADFANYLSLVFKINLISILSLCLLLKAIDKIQKGRA